MYAVVTGASGGIGREIALLLAQKGYNLILTARQKDKLLEVKTAAEQSYGVNAEVFQADLSDISRVTALVEFCRGFKIKVLVNNAGFGKIGLFKHIALEQEVAMINTNITALHILTKEFAAIIQPGGYILNVASMAAFVPTPYLAAYAATKAYVLSLSRAVGYELKRQNSTVSVTALCPGPVDTGFNSVAEGEFTVKSVSAEFCARVAVKAMLKRKSVCIVGRKMKFLRVFTKLLPTPLVLPVVYRIQKAKKP